MGNTIIPNVSADYVIEKGRYQPPSDNRITWTYRKWASGVSECWGNWSGSEKLSSGTSPFSSQWLKSIPYPPNLFINPSYPNVSTSAAIGSGYAILGKNYPHSDEVQVLYYSSSTGTVPITAWFYIIGHWK